MLDSELVKISSCVRLRSRAGAEESPERRQCAEHSPVKGGENAGQPVLCRDAAYIETYGQIFDSAAELNTLITPFRTFSEQVQQGPPRGVST